MAEICKRSQSRCSTVPLTVKHRHQQRHVEVLPSFTPCRWMNTNTARRQEYATLIPGKVLYTRFGTTRRRRTDVLWFVGCQNSTIFELAPLEMRGEQERALLVSDNNIGTYCLLQLCQNLDRNNSSSTQQVQTAVHHQRAYCVWYVVIWNQALCLLQMVIPLLLCRQQGEELDQIRMECGIADKTSMPPFKCVLVLHMVRLPNKHSHRRPGSSEVPCNL